VVCTDGVRSQHSPFRIEPHRGQVSKHGSESSKSEHWGVFHEHETGSYLANNPCHFPPQAGALAVDACALACGADVLAWESARNNVNSASPRSSVKGSNVIPDRERRKNSIVLSLEQNPNSVWLPLNGAHSAPAEQLAAEYSSTSASEKCQLIHFSSVSPFDGVE